MITVFTPTYNRASLLEICHESLCNQIMKDFEWIIVDDGSIDGTFEYVKNWLTEQNRVDNNYIYGMSKNGGFPITIIRQPHGGKHRATNLAAKHAKGELFFVLDSDDKLPSYSLKYIIDLFDEVRNDPRFGGVAAQKGHFNGTVFGPNSISCKEDMSYLQRKYVMGKKGDKCEVFKTDIIRAFPQPEIEGEDFCPESLVWNRISVFYILRYSQEIVYLCEYLPGGFTSHATLRRMCNPIATLMTYSELTRYKIPFLTKCRAAVNFLRFKPCMNKHYSRIGSNHGKSFQVPRIGWGWYILWPLGRMMHLRDLRKIESVYVSRT